MTNVNVTIAARLPVELVREIDRRPGRNRSEKLRELLSGSNVALTIATETATAVGREIAPTNHTLATLRNELEAQRQRVEEYTRQAAAASKNGEQVAQLVTAHIDKRLSLLDKALVQALNKIEQRLTGMRG